MANELCPRCGSEMVKEFTRCVDADGNAEVFYSCPLDPKDCRIAELERQLEEAEAVVKIQGDGLVRAETSIAELERQLEEAKVQQSIEWHDGFPDPASGSEWFIAVIKSGDRVVLTALPDSYSYDYKTADETFVTKESITKWSPFPDSEFMSPLFKTVLDLKSKLDAALAQVAVLREACLKFLDKYPRPHPTHPTNKGAHEAYEAIVQALSNTSATAQRVKAEIEREAVENFISTLEAELPKVSYHSANGYFRTGAFKPYHIEAIVKHIRAAILGEKAQ